VEIEKVLANAADVSQGHMTSELAVLGMRCNSYTFLKEKPLPKQLFNDKFYEIKKKIAIKIIERRLRF